MEVNQPSASPVLQALVEEVQRHIIGQHSLIERLLVALLADGHVLLEGVPGLAKTRALVALTRAIDARMARVQFTADLLPSDLVGTEVYRAATGSFEIRRGPIFTNLLLADEINRAPAKVQSALLQAMQERQVTIGHETFQLPDLFMVLATQNPIEQEGTYPLPEAQLDRFLMKVRVTYPSFEEEVRILNLVTSGEGIPGPQPVVSPESLLTLREECRKVFVDERIDRYIVALVHASRAPGEHGLSGMVDWGASPRAAIALKLCARALALIRGRGYVTPDDVKELAPDVLRHRILPSFEAEARGVDGDQIVKALLSSVTVP